MTINVQRVPRGLLQLIGSVSSGTNPTQLEEAIRGVVDLTQFWAQSQNVQQSIDATAAAFTSNAQITIPQNQWWLLVRMGAELAGAPSLITEASMELRIQPPQDAGAGTIVAANQLRWNAAAIAAGMNAGGLAYQCNVPELLAPGTALIARAYTDIAAGNRTLSLRAQVGILG